MFQLLNIPPTDRWPWASFEFFRSNAPSCEAQGSRQLGGCPKGAGHESPGRSPGDPDGSWSSPCPNRGTTKPHSMTRFELARFVSPLQGSSFVFALAYPGRCPGLSYPAPSGPLTTHPSAHLGVRHCHEPGAPLIRAPVVHGRMFRLPALTSVRISRANSSVARGCRRLDPSRSIRPATAAPTHSHFRNPYSNLSQSL
jgi:hypothetical protein